MLTVQQTIHERYQLQYKLGERPARQTWLARNTETDSLVVIKLLASSSQMQWNDLKLFEREAQILRELNHPSIPQYRDYFGIDEDTHWFAIVEDYIPGESLQTLLDRGKRFSESLVKKIAFELLDILDYLHQLNPPVLHRDIKPSNIILGEDERIYLVDFGSIQDKAAAKGASFTVVGTYGYTPMEQFGGKAVAASDLYALGATLIHLLTRIPPAELLQEDSQIQFQNRVEVTQHLADWLRKMTQPTLKERFRSVAQARQALETPSVENRAEQSELEPLARDNRAREDNYLPKVKLQPAQVEQQARQWQESGGKKDYLLLKTQLSEARIIQQQQPLSPLAQNFIAKSIEHREGEGKRKRIKFWGLSLIILAGTVIGGIIVNERLKLRELNAAIEEVKNCGEIYEKEWGRLMERTLANCKTEVNIIEDWANRRSLSNYDLQGAYLVSAELENADFSDTDFYIAILEDANFQGANLENTNFQDAEFENVNLQGADLRNANLQGVNLSHVNLKGANFGNANFQGAIFGNTELGGAKFEGSNFENANLKYVDFRNVEINNANFSHAKLQGIDLRGLDLKEVNFYDANLSDANLGGADLRDANLNNARLSDADLEGVDFQDADLYDANLGGANFKNVNLKNANLKNAIFVGAKLTPSQIKSACNWEEAQYIGTDKPKGVTIKAANEQYIEQLKQDKTSDPETPVDCSQWE